MKVIATILFVVFPVIAAAQKYPGMNEADMQQMMQVMQEMQACMEKIDQAELEALQQRSDEFDAEIKVLCDQGKRDEAEKKAIAYGKEMMNNPVVQQMQKCGEMAEGMMPPGQMGTMEDKYDYSEDEGHVCDQ